MPFSNDAGLIRSKALFLGRFDRGITGATLAHSHRHLAGNKGKKGGGGCSGAVMSAAINGPSHRFLDWMDGCYGGCCIGHGCQPGCQTLDSRALLEGGGGVPSAIAVRGANPGQDSTSGFRAQIGSPDRMGVARARGFVRCPSRQHDVVAPTQRSPHDLCHRLKSLWWCSATPKGC